jgi:CBS domain-containing protein
MIQHGCARYRLQTCICRSLSKYIWHPANVARERLTQTSTCRLSLSLKQYHSRLPQSMACHASRVSAFPLFATKSICMGRCRVRDALFRLVLSVSTHPTSHAASGGESGHGGDARQGRVFVCTRDEPLRSIVERLSAPGVRRLIVVQPDTRRVEGLVSLSDIASFLLT